MKVEIMNSITLVFMLVLFACILVKGTVQAITCREGTYQCADGNCVEGRMMCDGVPQCEDGSDEFGCPTEPPSCPNSDFQCTTEGRLECIDKRLQCDGHPDCSDGSDENNCPCADGQWHCTDSSCVPASMRCDGIPQCEDSSDEQNCGCECVPRDCSSDEVMCTKATCQGQGFHFCCHGTSRTECPSVKLE